MGLPSERLPGDRMRFDDEPALGRARGRCQRDQDPGGLREVFPFHHVRGGFPKPATATSRGCRAARRRATVLFPTPGAPVNSAITRPDV
jgi:hypothetical protein